jgi:hypothetical protein
MRFRDTRQRYATTDVTGWQNGCPLRSRAPERASRDREVIIKDRLIQCENVTLKTTRNSPIMVHTWLFRPNVFPPRQCIVLPSQRAGPVRPARGPGPSEPVGIFFYIFYRIHFSSLLLPLTATACSEQFSRSPTIPYTAVVAFLSSDIESNGEGPICYAKI